MTIQNRPIPSIQQVQNEHLKPKKVGQKAQESMGFDALLRQKLQAKEDVIFSKHASMRLQARNITLSEEQMTKLNQGIRSAEEKGIKESLVLVDNIALVVNIENKTVVTALDKAEAREHVFTNIDGAVVL